MFQVALIVLSVHTYQPNWCRLLAIPNTKKKFIKIQLGNPYIFNYMYLTTVFTLILYHNMFLVTYLIEVLAPLLYGRLCPPFTWL